MKHRRHLSKSLNRGFTLIELLVVIGIVLVGVLSPHDGYYRGLAIVFGGAVLVTFVIQLFLPQKPGLVVRMITSIAGSVALLAIATAVLFAVAALS